MKIKSWSDLEITFTDGSYIGYDHKQDCCENNWADFSVIEIFYNNEEFESYDIEVVEGQGFILILEVDNKYSGEERIFIPCYSGEKRIFIPCYSDQNGWYSSDIEIMICKDKRKRYIHLNAEVRDGK